MRFMDMRSPLGDQMNEVPACMHCGHNIGETPFRWSDVSPFEEGLVFCSRTCARKSLVSYVSYLRQEALYD